MKMRNKQKKHRIWICMLLLTFTTLTHAQNTQKIWHWMQQLGGPGWDIPTGICTDGKSNVYVAGGFTELLQHKGKKINSEGNRDIYVARFNEKGRLEWLWQAGGIYMDKITAVHAAPDNDLYITGIIEGEMKFGKQKIEGESKKLFLARINKRGKSDWVYTLPFYNAASGYLLNTDKKGNIYWAGTFADSLYCEKGDIVSHGHNDMFVARFSAEGTLEQIKQYGNKAAERLTALSVDSLGNVYLSGNIEKPVIADGLEMKAPSAKQAGNSFVLQLDSTLTAQWHKNFTSPSYSEISGLACDKENNVLISGNFNHELKLDTLTYPSNGLTDFFVCKADTGGTVQWMKTFGGKYSDVGGDIKLNKLGGAMVSGSFNDTLYMDSLMIHTLTGYSDAFIAQLNQKGEVTWAEAIHGDGGSSSTGGALDEKGNLYLMGSFKGTMKAVQTELESQGDEDIFVAKYYNCPPVANAIQHPPHICQGTTVSLSVDNSYANIVWNDTLKDVNEILIHEAGDYFVQMVDKRGCLVTDTVSIREVSAQEFSIGADTAMLINDRKELTGPDNAFAYQWNDDSNLQSLWAYCPDEKPGLYEYELTITDSLGCIWSSSVKIDFYKQPEYADLSEGERLITLFPNPVKESFNWYLETYKEVQMDVEIRNAAGEQVFYQKIDRYIPGQQLKVNVSDYSSGMYYFSVISNDKRITKKFVKE